MHAWSENLAIAKPKCIHIERVLPGRRLSACIQRKENAYNAILANQNPKSDTLFVLIAPKAAAMPRERKGFNERRLAPKSK